MSANLIDTITFRAKATGGPAVVSDLEAIRTKLLAVSSAVTHLQGNLAGLSTQSRFKRTRAELTDLFKPIATGTRKIVPVKDAAAAMGVPDVKDFEAFVNRWKRTHKDLKNHFASERLGGKGGRMETITGFASSAKAAQVGQAYLKQAAKGMPTTAALFEAMFKGGGGAGATPLKAGAAAAAAAALAVPANRIQATLGPGMVRLIVPSNRVLGTAAGGAAGRAGSAGGPTAGPLSSGNFNRTIADLKKQYAQALEAEAARNRATPGIADPRRVAAIRNKFAGQIDTAATAQLAANKDSTAVQNALRYAANQRERASKDVEKQILAARDQLRTTNAELDKLRNSALDDEAKYRKRQLQQQERAQRRLVADLTKANNAQQTAQEKITRAKAKTDAFTQRQADVATRRAATYAGAHHAMGEFQRGGGKVIREEATPGGGPRRVVLQRDLPNGMRETMFARFGDKAASVKLTQAAAPQGGLAKALGGFTLAGFGSNLAKVAGWSAAVGVLYKGLELVNYSMGRLLDIGLQTARLGQVFRQVGGDTNALRDDVLGLAADTGRATDEAMDSAVAWSRLGYSRKQVAEATRVSLMAANVAEMSAAESSGHMASLATVFKLRPNEHEGLLGMMNQISNTAKVTVRDLLEGMSNVAALGKEAGFSPAQMAGHIGGSVEVSGQSGGRMSNAYKNILTRLGRQDVQEYVRRTTGVDIKNADGSEKSRAEYLRQIFIAYQELNEAERTNFAGRVAGSHQANRFAAIMDSWHRSTELTVDAQLHLNSAQEENAKIINTLKSQLAGLRSEWDKLIVTSANAPGILGGDSPNQKVTDLVRFGKNAMGVVNNMPGGSGTLTGTMDVAMKGVTMTVVDRLLQYGMKRFNAVAESDFEKSRPGFVNKLQETMMRGASHRDRATQFDTVEKILGGKGSAENKRRAVEAVSGHLGPGFAQQPEGQQRKLLRAAEEAATAEAVKAEGEALTIQARRIQQTQEEIKLATARGQNTDELKRDLDDLQKVQSVVAGKYLDKEVDDAARVVELRHEQLAILHEQVAVLDSIQSRYRMFTPTTAVGARQWQNRMLDEQIAAMEALQNSPRFRKEFTDETTRVKFDEDLKALRATRAANNSPWVNENDQRVDLWQNQMRQFGRQLRPFQVGRDETEALLNEQSVTAARLKVAKDQVEVEMLKSRQLEIQQQLLDRQYEVQRQINQLIVDRRKEFEASVFTSGPAEMLRKLAAFRMGGQGQGMSAGKFLSMAPEMRREMGMLDPRFDPQMMALRQEQQRGRQAAWKEAAAGYQKNPNAETYAALRQAWVQLNQTTQMSGSKLNDLPFFSQPLPVTIVGGTQTAGSTGSGGAPPPTATAGTPAAAGAGTAAPGNPMSSGSWFSPSPAALTFGGAAISNLASYGQARGMGQATSTVLKSIQLTHAAEAADDAARVAHLINPQGTRADTLIRQSLNAANAAQDLRRTAGGLSRSAGRVGALGGVSRGLGLPFVSDLVDTVSTAAGGMSGGDSPAEALASHMEEIAKSRMGKKKNAWGDFLAGITVKGMLSSLVDWSGAMQGDQENESKEYEFGRRRSNYNKYGYADPREARKHQTDSMTPALDIGAAAVEALANSTNRATAAMNSLTAAIAGLKQASGQTNNPKVTIGVGGQYGGKGGGEGTTSK